MTLLTDTLRRLAPAMAIFCWAGAAEAQLSRPPVAETAWDETRFSGVRIVAGGSLEEGRDERLAGIQIRLAPGWKTYWRVPGDAGVPPLFDWSASTNVADVEVAFPAPGRYVDRYATTIGYKGEVVLPVLITPADPALPVTARVSFSYAVCREICLPVRSDFTLDIDGGPATSYRSLIDAHRAAVPVPGDGEASGVVSVATQGEGAKTRLLVDILPDTPGTVPEVFVEGPESFYFGNPEPASAAAPGRFSLSIPVDGVTAAHPLKGQALRLTVINGKRRVEQAVSVP